MTSPLTASASTWPVRMLRWIGCDRNPLRRTADLIEAWAILLVLVSYLPLSVLAAGLAGHQVRQAGTAAQDGPRPRPASAVVLTAAESTNPMATVWVPARWRTGGRVRTGELPVRYGTPAGAIVRIWVDQDGRLATPPLTGGQLKDQVLTIEIIVPVLLAQFFALSLGGLRWQLNRRRLARWESDWRAIAEQRTR